MNDESARDELDRIICEEVRDGLQGYDAPMPYADISFAVSAILAAGYRKPRTITERHEDNGADELPPLSVVISDGKPAIMQHDGTFMDHDGCSYDTWEMSYPVTVIHEPTTEATK